MARSNLCLARHLYIVQVPRFEAESHRLRPSRYLALKAKRTGLLLFGVFVPKSPSPSEPSCVNPVD